MKLETFAVCSLDHEVYGPAWKWGRNVAQLGLVKRIYEFWFLGLCVEFHFETTQREAHAFLKKETGN